MKTKNIFSALIAASLTTSSIFAQGITLQTEVHNPTCHGDNNGAIYVTPIGGTAPYTYIWSTADNTYSAKDLIAGDYGVTVVDASGNSVSETFTLTQPDYVNITGVVTKVTNFGGTDGAIDVNVTGLTPGAVIKWNTNHGTGLVADQLDQSGLSAGMYALTVTTNDVCVSTRSFIVTQKMPRLVNSDMLNNLNSSGSFGHMPLVYPNPSKGQVNFRNVEATDLIEIHNQFGVLVQQVNAMEGTQLPVGNYNVVITHNDGTREVETLVVR